MGATDTRRRVQRNLLHACPGRNCAPERNAVEDGARESTVGSGRGHQRTHVGGAGGLTKDGDALRIAAETLDVAAHPVEPEDLIGEAQIGGVRFRKQGGVRQIAERAESEFDGHDHDVVCRQAIALEGDVPDGSSEVDAAAVRRAGHVASTVQEHHDWQRPRPSLRCPDVDGEAVLYAVHRAGDRDLRTARPLLGGVAHIAPCRARLCLAPPERALRSGRVRDAEKDFDAGVHHPAHRAGLRSDDGRRLRRRGLPARARDGARKDEGNPSDDERLPHR